MLPARAAAAGASQSAAVTPVVCCVLRSGGLYDAGWVTRLQAGVRRHTTTPHRFVCLSDVDVPGAETVPLLHDWPGWWAKMELFRPGLWGKATVLFLDLDSVVVADLAPLLAHPHRFTMAHEYYRPAQFCSTAMAWAGDWSALYRMFADDPAAGMQRYTGNPSKIGDQAFIEDGLSSLGVTPATFRDLFGERAIASYKVHRCEARPARDALVVSFHGRPKPHELQSGWVAEAWRS
jgi:hypothetical protein